MKLTNDSKLYKTKKQNLLGLSMQRAISYDCDSMLSISFNSNDKHETTEAPAMIHHDTIPIAEVLAMRRGSMPVIRYQHYMKNNVMDASCSTKASLRTNKKLDRSLGNINTQDSRGLSAESIKQSFWNCIGKMACGTSRF